MNTETNKQVVRDFVQRVWVERHLGALPDFWTSDCVNYAMPLGSDNRGLSVLQAYHEQFLAAFSALSDIHIDIVQQVAEEDRVVTQMTTRAKHTGTFLGHAPTGKTIALDSIRIDRLDAGKIAEHWSVADMVGLMQQMSG